MSIEGKFINLVDKISGFLYFLNNFDQYFWPISKRFSIFCCPRGLWMPSKGEFRLGQCHKFSSDQRCDPYRGPYFKLHGKIDRQYCGFYFFFLESFSSLWRYGLKFRRNFPELWSRNLILSTSISFNICYIKICFNFDYFWSILIKIVLWIQKYVRFMKSKKNAFIF